MRKSGIPACLMLLIALDFAGAESLTVSIVQNEKAPAVALEMSQTIEDELMNDYFDAGHIVSNTDIRFDGSKFKAANFGIKEAAFGMSDYLLAVYLQYGPGEIKDEKKGITYAQLDTVVWRLVEVRSSNIVAEQTLDATKIHVTDFDPYQQSRLVADQASGASIDALNRNKTGGKNK
jgi:hypothetical protein